MGEIPFLPAARQEFLVAVDHYEAVSPGLGTEFISEVEGAVARIAAFPTHGSPYYSGTRRVVLGRFPFDIVYLQENSVLLVIAVAHQRREPLYWRGRL